MAHPSPEEIQTEISQLTIDARNLCDYVAKAMENPVTSEELEEIAVREMGKIRGLEARLKVVEKATKHLEEIHPERVPTRTWWFVNDIRQTIKAAKQHIPPRLRGM